MITILLSSIYMVLALLQYLVAPRVRPNPVFGFRIGYTFASRESWEKSNRFVGMLMTIHALLLFPLAILGDKYIILYLIAFIVPLILILPVGIWYASRILEVVSARKSVGGGERIKPIRVERFWLWAPLISYVLLLSIMIATYPYLPEILAVHFDIQGKPDGWSSRSSFLLSYSLIALVPMGIAYIYAFLASRYPLYLHPGQMRFKRNAILKTLLMAMTATNFMLLLTYVGVLVYAITGENYINAIIVLSLFIVLSPLIWLYTKGREKGGGKI